MTTRSRSLGAARCSAAISGSPPQEHRGDLPADVGAQHQVGRQFELRARHRLHRCIDAVAVQLLHAPVFTGQVSGDHGELALGAFGLTEPDAGSDAGGLMPHGQIGDEVEALKGIGMSPTAALGAACWDARAWLGRRARAPRRRRGPRR